MGIKDFWFTCPRKNFRTNFQRYNPSVRSRQLEGGFTNYPMGYKQYFFCISFFSIQKLPFVYFITKEKENQIILLAIIKICDATTWNQIIKKMPELKSNSWNFQGITMTKQLSWL